jgi:hypothetical protein
MQDEEYTRKERLLDLFQELEEAERQKMNKLKKSQPTIKYERMFKGVGTITGINGPVLRLERENGKKIKRFEVNPEIAKLLKKDDQLMMIAGLRQGMWRLIRLDCMGSQVSINGKPSMHVSIMNRLQNPSFVH